TTLYVFDAEDPIIAAYRGIFPSLFKDAAAMPPALRKHVRYPEMQLRLQASVYGLYHMTDPAVFYNREDLWSIASEVGMNNRREQATQTMDPNFVLMTLPGERSPMPELRLVVLALQDRLAYGPTFEAAMTGLFGGGASSTTATTATTAAPASTSAAPAQANPSAAPPGAASAPAVDVNALIAQ